MFDDGKYPVISSRSEASPSHEDQDTYSTGTGPWKMAEGGGEGPLDVRAEI